MQRSQGYEEQAMPIIGKFLIIYQHDLDENRKTVAINFFKNANFLKERGFNNNAAMNMIGINDQNESTVIFWDKHRIGSNIGNNPVFTLPIPGGANTGEVELIINGEKSGDLATYLDSLSQGTINTQLPLNMQEVIKYHTVAISAAKLGNSDKVREKKRIKITYSTNVNTGEKQFIIHNIDAQSTNPAFKALKEENNIGMTLLSDGTVALWNKLDKNAKYIVIDDMNTPVGFVKSPDMLFYKTEHTAASMLAQIKNVNPKRFTPVSQFNQLLNIEQANIENINHYPPLDEKLVANGKETPAQPDDKMIRDNSIPLPKVVNDTAAEISDNRRVSKDTKIKEVEAVPSVFWLSDDEIRKMAEELKNSPENVNNESQRQFTEIALNSNGDTAPSGGTERDNKQPIFTEIVERITEENSAPIGEENAAQNSSGDKIASIASTISSSNDLIPNSGADRNGNQPQFTKIAATNIGKENTALNSSGDTAPSGGTERDNKQPIFTEIVERITEENSAPIGEENAAQNGSGDKIASIASTISSSNDLIPNSGADRNGNQPQFTKIAAADIGEENTALNSSGDTAPSGGTERDNKQPIFTEIVERITEENSAPIGEENAAQNGSGDKIASIASTISSSNDLIPNSGADRNSNQPQFTKIAATNIGEENTAPIGKENIASTAVPSKDLLPNSIIEQGAAISVDDSKLPQENEKSQCKSALQCESALIAEKQQKKELALQLLLLGRKNNHINDVDELKELISAYAVEFISATNIAPTMQNAHNYHLFSSAIQNKPANLHIS